MKYKQFIIILIVIGFCLFFLSFFNGFIWDDEEQVVNNTLVHSLGNIPTFFTGSTFNTGGAGILGGIYYKPMMSVFFSILYTIFGGGAFGFHLFQVTLHIANAILVFVLLLRLLGEFDKSNSYNNSKWIAFGASVLFLVHPINVEAVVYVSALQDVLFLFFGMLALLITVYKENPFLNKIEEATKIKTHWWSALLLFLSVLSKETGIVFVGITFAYVIIFDKKVLLNLIKSSSVMLAVYFILRVFIAKIPFSKGGISPIMRVSFSERMQTVPKIIYHYLITLFNTSKLAIAQHWVVEEANWGDFYFPLVIVTGFLLLLIILGIFLKKRRNNSFKIYLFFVLWFLGALLLHLQIIPLDMTVADRWFYLPFVGLAGAFSIVIFELIYLKKESIRSVVALTSGIVILILSFRSLNRTLDWSDGLKLFSKDIEISSESFDLQNNLGVELFRTGNVAEAKVHFTRSVEIAPYWWTNWNNLGAIVEREGKLEKAEDYYLVAIQNGDYFLAYENYAMILIKQEKYDEAKKFLAEDALLKFPYNERLNQAYIYIQTKEDSK
ncbi:MAG: hypothetical protein ABIE03_02215 [Patescibacteria group bacterium]|nr:hypothetical protein [Patescibacteria group bacterium]